MQSQDIIKISHIQLSYITTYSLLLNTTNEMIFKFIIETILSKRKVLKINSIDSIIPISGSKLQVRSCVTFKEKDKTYPINCIYNVNLDGIKIFIRDEKIKYIVYEN